MSRTISPAVGMVLAIGLAVVRPSLSGGQSAGTEEVLERTTQYVEEFVERFANVVAEERYVQTTNPSNPGPGPRRRELVSDFLLVRAQGTRDWYQFRDVREVDGKAVRDRDDRLTTLFLQPWETAFQQAVRIADEGARYNLVNVGTVNFPLIALAFFQAHYRDRFEFSLGRREPDLGPGVRVVNFRELDTPTPLLAGPLASGRAWVEEATGRVVRTDLRLRAIGQRYAIAIATDFAFDDRLGLAVPVEMRDSYPLDPWDMTGVATYGRFRTFQVHTEETVQPQ